MGNTDRILMLINNFDIEKEEIQKKILPYLQELIVEQLRPAEIDLINWKTHTRGRFHFREFMNSKSKKKISEVHLDALWRYYMGTVNSQRSKVTVDLFKLRNIGNEFCAHCYIRKDLEVDHIIPLVKGGLDVVENLQFLCSECNSEKHGRYDYKKLII